MKKEDSFYIKKVLEGDKEYFSFLVEKYQNHIFNSVNKVLKNRNNSEDITQEAFLRAFVGLKNFDRSKPFYPYLIKIAMNCTKDYIKRKDKNLKECIDTQKASEDSDKIEEVYELIYAMPDIYRDVILLRYRDGKNISRIATELQLSKENVKVRLFRGRKILFEKWKERQK